MYIKKCEFCGKEFSAKKATQRFCCHKCSSEYVKEHKKPKDIAKYKKVECAYCHKIEYVSPSRAAKYKCCSVDCLKNYNSKRYSQKVTLICPICGKKYECKQSKISHHKTCGDINCRREWLKLTRIGAGNSNYRSVEDILKKEGINGKNTHGKSKTIYQHIAKEVLGLNSVKNLPKGYVIHHKDANHENNNPKNLVMLPKTAHRIIHTWFGNIMINALHTGKITREEFYKACTPQAWDFYKEIIDLDITHQAVVKQGELLENPEVDNQQPSIYRNIIEGSTTNERVLTDIAEDSNFDTSALPVKDGDEIV